MNRTISQDCEVSVASACPECGASLLHGDTFQENFHALLLLEGQVPGAPGSITHFFTVACYVLQHPDSMNFTADALQGLETSLREALAGRATVEDLRRRARYAANGNVRVTRRESDPPVSWRRGGWQMTVADVVTVAPDEYVDTVQRWARSISDTLAGDPS